MACLKELHDFHSSKQTFGRGTGLSLSFERFEGAPRLLVPFVIWEGALGLSLSCGTFEGAPGLSVPFVI
jgi:hypothetical protein